MSEDLNVIIEIDEVIIMVLSKETIEIFKLLSQISENICVTESSNFIRVLDESFSIAADAYVKETFSATCAFNVSKLLGIYSIISEKDENVKISFTDKFIDIVSSSRKASLTAIDPKMLTFFNFINKTVSLPSSYIASFRLEKDILKELRKAASFISTSSGSNNVIDIYSDGLSTIKLTLLDSKNPTTDIYTISCEGDIKSEGNVRIIYDLVNKIYPQSCYNVVLYESSNEKTKVKFEMEDFNVVYYVSGMIGRN
ncbi:MAG: hypothetical protein N3A54_01720 [Patescibacteria group bacterium]|nr:hypothetical protein [Patescibacteria group bacterium]